MNKLLTRVYQQAKTEGRLCSRCGWIITKKGWKKGYRICSDCASALKGVSGIGVDHAHGPYRDEPVEKTGNTL